MRPVILLATTIIFVSNKAYASLDRPDIERQDVKSGVLAPDGNSLRFSPRDERETTYSSSPSDSKSTIEQIWREEPSLSRSQGWLNRWLAIGGEGSVVIQLAGTQDNVSLPHRPSAFPSQLFPPFTLPISGTLKPFTSFLETSAESDQTPHAKQQDRGTRSPSPIQGCVAQPLGHDRPSYADDIALIERGGCDFARKVRAAQVRGASGVIVGDGPAREGETDQEGRLRENLITMFSPEDTYDIYIPSVFVSRASYLFLMDIFQNQTSHGFSKGIRVEISEGADEGGALSSLLSFALLMPSLFLLATIAIHRIRVARQREAERAPPMVVLSLPERIWTPDIIWEKDSDTESTLSSPSTPTPQKSSSRRPFQHSQASSRSINAAIVPPPPPISSSEVVPAPPEAIDMITSSRPKRAHISPSAMAGSGSGFGTGTTRTKARTKSGVSAKKYFSKDECAICMDSFQRGEIVRILPCGHVFHKDECDEWLMKWRKLCPTCRADVTVPPGGSMDGTTMTPVALQDTDGSAAAAASNHPIASQTLRERVSHALARTRRSIFRRNNVRLDDEEGGRGAGASASASERTPLVRRSAENSSD
ncbi:hypothetical protein BD324DRAFT_622508 [Kockovaella imperatae]|uniref:RING-type domain-containing protein n=1 Tax=Kockovaella imperatae TaxID=4999 RepID=A0A1Y1UHP5_9TREE|nr:hypothetical protein BD324DRAFT_622508 [Kockovaella imperatae]ORX37580.1 hypothetical protein BD324DRAFT_622508 [Kockovaella imperatae]